MLRGARSGGPFPAGGQLHGRNPGHPIPEPGWLARGDSNLDPAERFQRASPAKGAAPARQTVGILPDSFAGESHAGDLALESQGGFLFATNRGHDSIAVLPVGPDGLLAPPTFRPSGGNGPQSLAFSRCGRWLFCAHLAGHRLAILATDPITGLAQTAPRIMGVASASCVVVQPTEPTA